MGSLIEDVIIAIRPHSELIVHTVLIVCQESKGVNF